MQSLGIYDYRQAKWKTDINSYYRWKRFLEVCTTESVRKKIQERMEEIKSEWPHHAKHFN